MTNSSQETIAQQLERELEVALFQVQRVPSQGARELDDLEGLTLKPGFILPQENVIIAAAEFLASSQRVFRYGARIVFEIRRSSGAHELIVLSESGDVASGAEDYLANLFRCRLGEGEFPPPRWFVELLFRSELLFDRLPSIQHYSKRPFVSASFQVLQGGWNAADGVLVHSEQVEIPPYSPNQAAEPLDRLPRTLRALLQGFCFATASDLVNYLGLLLTVVLSHRFVASGKALGLFNGNQPGLGKTSLASIGGVIADGQVPRPTRYTSDEEEFEKKLCATARNLNQSVILIDNAKTKGQQTIDSAVLEANCVAPQVCFRLLGHSTIFERENDLIWMITANHARVSADLEDRGFVINLFSEGPASDRCLPAGDPVEFAKQHRLEILGELFGMIVHWAQQGCPLGHHHHRLRYWSQIVGGILQTAGFPEFLANMEATANQITSELQELATLAERVANVEGFYILAAANGCTDSVGDRPDVGRPPAQWVNHFVQSHVLRDSLRAEQTPRANATAIGRYFTPLVGRRVQIEIGEQSMQATLRSRATSGNRKLYWFELQAVLAPGQACPFEPPAPAGGRDAPTLDAPTTHSQETPGLHPATPSTGGNDEQW